MLPKPGQSPSKTFTLKKITKVRPRKKVRVIRGILGDARSDPQGYLSRYVVQRGAE